MAKRRSLTPGTGSEKGDVHATRRGTGGARREVTDRVVLRAVPSDGLVGGRTSPAAGAELSGWALNASRGGIRIILEDKVELGHEYDVEVGGGEGAGKARRGRVVWVQEEADGMIVGVEFVDQKGEGTPGNDPPGGVRKDT
jgi:PilZ domain